MSWWAVGSAAVSVVGGIASSVSGQNQQTKGINAMSKAEGEAAVKERLNATIRNAYNVSLSQQQLALQKRQLSNQAGQIGEVALQAHANADTAIAATGSIGASTAAIKSDIDMKAQQALDITTDAFEQAVNNYNQSLDLMVLNTEQGAQGAREARDGGPSTGAIVGANVLGGLSQLASNYALRSMSLGSGNTYGGINASALSNGYGNTFQQNGFSLNPSYG